MTASLAKAYFACARILPTYGVMRIRKQHDDPGIPFGRTYPCRILCSIRVGTVEVDTKHLNELSALSNYGTN